MQVFYVSFSKRKEGRRKGNEPSITTMKKVSIYNNYGHNHQHKRSKVVKLLRENGFSPMSAGEMVIVIGGDGTFLSAVKERYNHNPAFIALNSGNLGFFSEFHFNDAKDLMKMLKSGQYRIEEYPIYQVEIVQNNGRIMKEFFVNDCVIERKSSKIVHMNMKLDNKNNIPFASDGIIVASSLGSSGYTKSGGGAILLDHQPIFQISAISQVHNNAYSGLTNSAIVSDQTTLEITPSHKKMRSFRVVCDGKEIKAKNIKSIKITNRKQKFRVIRSKDFDMRKHIQSKLF